jgi:hypothetical protein
VSPGQESVDKYLRANFPPCRKELDAYRAELRAKVALHEQRARMLITNPGTGPMWLATADAYADVLGLIDEGDEGDNHG